MVEIIALRALIALRKANRTQVEIIMGAAKYHSNLQLYVPQLYSLDFEIECHGLCAVVGK